MCCRKFVRLPEWLEVKPDRRIVAGCCGLVPFRNSLASGGPVSRDYLCTIIQVCAQPYTRALPARGVSGPSLVPRPSLLPLVSGRETTRSGPWRHFNARGGVPQTATSCPRLFSRAHVGKPTQDTWSSCNRPGRLFKMPTQGLKKHHNVQTKCNCHNTDTTYSSVVNSIVFIFFF